MGTFQVSTVAGAKIYRLASKLSMFLFRGHVAAFLIFNIMFCCNGRFLHCANRMKHVREHGATEHYFCLKTFWLLVASLSTSLQLFIYWSGQRLRRPVLN